MANERLALAYDEVDPRKAVRLRDCATALVYNRETGGGGIRLVRANFCRVRLCPMCNWRRALKVGGQMSQIMAAIAQDRRVSYVLLTLTRRNVPGPQLSAALDELMEGWQRITQRVAYRRAVLGHYRALEVTHNLDPASDWYDTYHPHYHVLLAVRPSYYTSRDYISQARWVQMWREAMRLDYDPSVDVRRVKGDTTAAVAEAAKYAVKASDILSDDWDATVETVRLLDRALHQRRLIAYGGIIGEYHRRLHLDDAEDGDLVHTDDEPSAVLDQDQAICYIWHSGYRQYYRHT